MTQSVAMDTLHVFTNWFLIRPKLNNSWFLLYKLHTRSAAMQCKGHVFNNLAIYSKTMTQIPETSVAFQSRVIYNMCYICTNTESQFQQFHNKQLKIIIKMLTTTGYWESQHVVTITIKHCQSLSLPQMFLLPIQQAIVFCKIQLLQDVLDGQKMSKSIFFFHISIKYNFYYFLFSN